MSATEPLDVCVVGFGAIGALYAYALEKTGRVRITAVCRSNHVVRKELGTDIDSDRIGSQKGWKPHRMVNVIADAADRTYAYIICAFKYIPEVASTPALLTPLIAKLALSPPTNRPATFVLLQNGIGIEDDLLSALKDLKMSTVVISGCCWLDTTALEGGRRIEQRGAEKLVLGYHKPPCNTASFSEDAAQKALTEISDILRAAGSDVIATPDTDVERWRKILWNASLSTLCTLTLSNVGEVMSHETTRAEVQELMGEALGVARAWLPPSPAVEEVLSDHLVEFIMTNVDRRSVFRPSMLLDLEYGRPMEVEATVGGILKRARAKGVPTPKLELVYAGLSLLQAKLIAKS